MLFNCCQATSGLWMNNRNCDMTQLDEFAALGLDEKVLPAIQAKGFETPSPIQKLTIPVLLDEKRRNDLIAQAQTGTGKTAAFGLPLLERLTPKKARFRD